MRQNQFYCVACARKVTVKPEDICITTIRNKKRRGGVPTMVGWCNKCECELYKFIKDDDKQRYIDKYGKC